MSNTHATSNKEAKSQKLQPPGCNIHIAEEVKVAVAMSLERFHHSDEKEIQFPSSLSNTERAFIHRVARALGYISKSKGQEFRRFLTVKKRDGSDEAKSTLPLIISHNSLLVVGSLLRIYPVSKRERADLQLSGRRSCLTAEADSFGYGERASNHLNNSLPKVPQKRTPSELDGVRRSLPVYKHQEEIVQLTRNNKVVLVVGEAGSGKTTQIPQFLLDDCSGRGEPCRIFCTQPRRLAAMTVAERVAAERGESLGLTVAYHTRLESRVSPKTLLTFCTSRMFLRTLMSGDDILTSVTHVIVDEVHERDGVTDFLLTKMREVLPKVPTLKLILSGAALDVKLFTQYFGSCPVIFLKVQHFEVKELFLEDILRMMSFNMKDNSKYKEGSQTKENRQKCLTEWCETVDRCSTAQNHRTHRSAAGLRQDSGCVHGNKLSDNSREQVDPWLQKEIDSCISHIFLYEDQEGFIQLLNLIIKENMSVDYAHSETGTTPLMVAAGRGFLPQMEQLINMGADITIKAANGWSALDFAQHFQHADAVDLLKSAIPLGPDNSMDEFTLEAGITELNCEDQELLKLYHNSFSDQWLDMDLIMDLLHSICSSNSDGAVLVFLPGYDDIVMLRDHILCQDTRFTTHSERYKVFMLHSDIQTPDQRRAMKTFPPGVRKIILSTDIADMSIPINDVAFVIDSGKVKEKSFDMLSQVSMLKTVWISKASALERKGRAGRCRPGICFRLFSQLSLNNMLEYQVPQLLRMPLQELVLQTKLLAPPWCQIAEFLSKAPRPPPLHSIQNAVQMLKTIDAMDQHEELTDLGYHLSDLPVEPHLGKMVLCAVVLKCLDPILTIACSLAYRDPFILPTLSSQKPAALHSRKQFTLNTFSDHMALLRAFQAWQKAKTEGWEKSFCEKNFLSQVTMDKILGKRTQLLGQLRAIGFVQARGCNNIRDVNQNSENWAVVKAALVAGMYPNLVHINRETSVHEKRVLFHPTSVLSQSQFKEPGSTGWSQALPTDWLIYEEMRQGHKMASVRCCSLVTSITVAVFGGKRQGNSMNEGAEKATGGSLEDLSDSEMEDQTGITIDDWLIFQLEKEAAALVSELRQKWFNLFTWRIRYPTKPWSEQDKAIVDTLVSVLSMEEKSAGLLQPAGIGQVPRPMIEEGVRSSVKTSWSRPKIPASCDNHRQTPGTDMCQMTVCNGDEAPPSINHFHEGSQFPTSASGSAMKPLGQSAITKAFQAVFPQPSLLSIRYFIMKSNCFGNIETSQQRGIWSTSPRNEAKLTKAFQDNRLVFLIFSVQGSGHFQGFAHMTSEISQDRCQDWGLDGLGGIFSVKWIHKEKLSFHCTQHILNPWNENKRVQMSRDGQELEPQTGSLLLLMWERNSGRRNSIL